MSADNAAKLQIIRLITINKDYDKIKFVNNVLYYDDKVLNLTKYYEVFQKRNKILVDKDIFTGALIEIANAQS
jgi:uncharacterized protein (DUF4213/DUF364 family)